MSVSRYLDLCLCCAGGCVVEAWVTVTSGVLPSPRKGLRGATLGNKVIVTGEMRVCWEHRHYSATSGGGGSGGNKDDILEWDPALQRWSINTNKMNMKRAFHAVSVVEFDETICK